MSRKLLVQDGVSQRELLLIGTMVVGRHPSCEISSPDPRLSRRHAEICVTPDGVSVRDLHSRNGIRVNGQRVTEARLQPGDTVHVAHLALQFLSGESAVSLRPACTGTCDTLAIAAPIAPDDDRTRMVRPSAFGVLVGDAAARVGVAGRHGGTRVARAPAGVDDVRSAQPIALGAPSATEQPMDAADVIIRAVGESRPSPGVSEMGMGALARAGWGRRVLAHGVLLAVLVQGVTLVPVLVWQSHVFGASILSAWHVLLPALAASVLAGLLVSTIIARLTARGLAAPVTGAPRAG